MKTAFLALLAVLLVGCGSSTSGNLQTEVGNNGGNPDITPGSESGEIEFQLVRLAGDTSEDSTVTVNGIADQDGIVNTSWRVEFTFGSGIISDPGAGVTSSLQEFDIDYDADATADVIVDFTFVP